MLEKASEMNTVLKSYVIACRNSVEPQPHRSSEMILAATLHA